jgi:hypothetical protein
MGFWDSIKNWVSNTYNKAKDTVSNVWNQNIKPVLNKIPGGGFISNQVENLGRSIDTGAQAIGNLANANWKDAGKGLLKLGVEHLGKKLPVLGDTIAGKVNEQIDKFRHGGMVGGHLPKRFKHTFQK